MFVSKLNVLLGLAGITILIGAGSAGALTIHVPGDYENIWRGLGHADPGDTVLLAPGTYTESGDYQVQWNLEMASGVVLRGATGNPADVILDGEFAGMPIMRCFDTVAGTAIEAVTFTRGGGEYFLMYEGGAIYAGPGEFLLKDCIFLDNRAGEGGGAIRSDYGTVTAESCDFVRNRGYWGYFGLAGGAVNGTHATLSFTDCLFEENYPGGGSAGLAIHVQDTQLTVDACRFIGNWDGGGTATIRALETSSVFVSHSYFAENLGERAVVSYIGSGSDGTFESCTFVDNHGEGGPQGDLLMVGGMDSSLNILNSTFDASNSEGVDKMFWRGSASTLELQNCLLYMGEGVDIENCDYELTLTCCNAYSPYGEVWTDCYADQLGVNGNISADPEFCGVPGSGNYYLQNDSPCAPANNDCGVQMGAWPVGCEGVATQRSSFSALKSMY